MLTNPSVHLSIFVQVVPQSIKWEGWRGLTKSRKPDA